MRSAVFHLEINRIRKVHNTTANRRLQSAGRSRSPNTGKRDEELEVVAETDVRKVLFCFSCIYV